MKDKSKLSKILSEYQKKHRLSYRAMAEKAEKDLSVSRICNIIAGSYGELKPPAIEALGRLLDVEPAQVMAWHSGAEPPKSAVYLSRMQAFINDFTQLNKQDQEFIMPHIEMLHGEVRKRLHAKTRSTFPDTERTMGGEVMKEPTGNDQVFDLMAITDEVQAQGFDVDDALVEAVIVGEAADVNPALVEVILAAAGIHTTTPDCQSRNPLPNGK